MSNNLSDWPSDIASMHTKFGVREVVGRMSSVQLHEYLKFRLDMWQEELDECRDALAHGQADDVVDALIDGIVFALGTLDVFGVDAARAWSAVHTANMAKEPGIKAERPNKFGFPDLIKPPGWTAPHHWDNLGLLPAAVVVDPGKLQDYSE